MVFQSVLHFVSCRDPFRIICVKRKPANLHKGGTGCGKGWRNDETGENRFQAAGAVQPGTGTVLGRRVCPDGIHSGVPAEQGTGQHGNRSDGRTCLSGFVLCVTTAVKSGCQVERDLAAGIYDDVFGTQRSALCTAGSSASAGLADHGGIRDDILPVSGHESVSLADFHELHCTGTAAEVRAGKRSGIHLLCGCGYDPCTAFFVAGARLPGLDLCSGNCLPECGPAVDAAGVCSR